MSACWSTCRSKGQTRKAVVTAGKLGIIETLDRTNGQFLWAKETVLQNVVKAIDPKTGAKTINEDAMPHIGKTTFNCPADPGARGWPSTAYSPKTQMLYLPMTEYCSNTTPTPLEPGADLYRRRPRGLCARADPEQRRQVRASRRREADGPDASLVAAPARAMSSGVLPTAGGLLFRGHARPLVPRL